MCGIAGIVSTDGRAIDPALLGRMTDLVAYRGPDDQGFLLGAADGTRKEFRTSGDLAAGTGFVPTLGLGHRRLSILDLTEAGRQPMSYADGAFWVVFNGEVYNYIELEQELAARGYRFRTRCDTEVILAAYDAWGDDCVHHFNGMWAFALWDVRRARLFAARDRWGIKPFYWRWDGGRLLFGSEMKQLILDAPAVANRAALFDLLVIGFSDHEASTCIEGVQQLQGGQRLSLDLRGGKPAVETYYELKADRTFGPGDVEPATELVRTLLEDSVHLRLRSDVPVGSCLSGGLDSSTVVANMSRLRRAAGNAGEQHTFTFVSSDPSQDESRFAELVAAATGVERHIIRPSPEEIRAEITKHIWHMDQPVGGLSVLAQWFVFKEARAQGIPVMLDGQGGDELFLGYERYYATALGGLLRRGRLLEGLREFTLSGVHSGAHHLRQLLYYLYFQFPSARGLRIERRATGWLRKEFLAPFSARRRIRTLESYKDIEALQVQEVCRINLPKLLRFEDRNSMAFSVEARLPLLDYRLVELAVGLPWQLKIREGWTKYVLRRAAEKILPLEIAWRRNKIGFAAPQGQWLSLLGDNIRSLVAGDLASAPVVDADRLRRAVAGNLLEPTQLWLFYNLEHWARLFSVRF